MFNSLIDIIIYGGIPIIFLLIFLEGNPIIGSFIPGQTIVISIGFLEATSSIFNKYLIILTILLGGFLGDILGFIMGKKLNSKQLKKLGLNKNSHIFKSSAKFFKKFGPLSIILGREFNLTRAFIPFLAGFFKYTYKKFIIFSLISNIIWTSLSFYIGYYFGIIIINKIRFAMEFLILISIYIIIIYFIYKNFKKIYEKNYKIYKNYSINNILIIIFSFTILISLLLFAKKNFISFINNSFSFLFISNLYYFKFILTEEFLLFIIWCILMYLIYKKQFKLIPILFIVIFISILLLVTSSLLFKKIFNIEIYYSIITFTQIIFYSFIISKIFIKKKKKKLIYEIGLIIILLTIFLIKFSETENIYMIFISFLISLIISEIIIILSHYNILNNEISKIYKKE